MSTVTPEDMQKAEAALATVRDDWLAREGVTAVDLGFKWSQGAMTGQLAIRVHLAQKKPLSELEEEDLFPKEIDGVLIDVIEATYGIQTMLEGDVQLEAAVDGRDQRFTEIPLGVSIGGPNVTAGTLGAKVYDADTQEAYILSNWHVLLGDTSAQIGDPIWQPGKLDGGQSSDKIAEVTRSVLGPFDAAVARITGERPILDTTLEGDKIEDTIAPRLGMMVWKSGRTTGRTEGFIDGMMMSTQINYGAAGVRRLEQVVRVIPRPGSPPGEVSLGGDSGSVWVDEESGKAIGLHFAGEIGNAPEHALANDINAVVNRLSLLFPAQRPSEEPPTDPDPPIDPDPSPIPPPIDPGPVTPPQLSFWERLLQWLRGLFG
ncbi:MAG: hypothetical protein GY796_22785 [Chloroflexi bacterium]|nr:hypothetical protein [Chloroflexota bacterium]